MILPQQSEDLAKAISEKSLRHEAPDTFAYFKLFESSLRNRSGYKKFFRPGIDPFYSVYNVGEYTFAKYKVLWREVAQDLRAAVSIGDDQPLVPDHTLVMVSVGSADEAHYVCALLNSAPANYIVANYVALHPAPHVLKYIAIRGFDEKSPQHRTLARLSNEAHVATASDDEKRVKHLEAEIDKVAASMWGITDNELRVIQEASGHPSNSNRGVSEDDEK